MSGPLGVVVAIVLFLVVLGSLVLFHELEDGCADVDVTVLVAHDVGGHARAGRTPGDLVLRQWTTRSPMGPAHSFSRLSEPSRTYDGTRAPALVE